MAEDRMLMEIGEWFGKVSYNELLKPRLFYDNTSKATRLLNTGHFQIPNPISANSNYRTVYMDGGYIFVTPQTRGDVAYLEQYARLCRDLDGEIAEAGVYYGSTARLILKFFDGTNKTLHLFDTFETMPPAGEHDIPTCWNPQKNLSVEFTKKILGDYRNYVKFHKGLFKDTLHEVKDKMFCFVHIDCDLYEGAKDATEFFYPRMVDGGVMLFHDYTSQALPGVKRAVDEFFLSKDDFRTTNRFGGHHLVMKGVNHAQ